MLKSGLEVTQDPMGSIFGTLPGTDPTAGAVATGSHCDAIPLAGAYDGTIGVVGGIAALKALRDAGFKPRRPIQVIFFTSEEPTRFGLSCLGSRAMAGAISPKILSALRDENGTRFLDAATRAGAGGSSEVDVLNRSRLTKAHLATFVELHIEQGPLLEAARIPIGVVTAIAAPATVKVKFQGGGGHAGTLLMRDRSDPSLAAAQLALYIEAAALETGVQDTVATVGKWEIDPNAVNSVPREVTLWIDIRDIDVARRDSLVNRTVRIADMMAERRNVSVEVEVLNSDSPATSAPEVVDAIEATVRAAGVLKSMRMVSRAYHDTLFMAQIAPSGMIFIPCAHGISHRPDEFASPEDIEAGVRVLAGTLARLAGTAEGGGKDGEL